ncbi:MAG: histidine kinase, partial [Xanthomarina sp.]
MMSKNTKNIFLTFGIGCIVFLIGNAIFTGFEFEDFNEFSLNFVFYQLYAFILGYSNMYFFDYLEKYPWKDKDSVKRVAIGISGSVVITLIGLFFLRMFTAMFYNKESFETFITNDSYRNYTFGLWITLTIVITFHAVYLFKKNQDKKVKESQIVAQTQMAKFDALKNQLDPHFLFNSLNVLTSLI